MLLNVACLGILALRVGQKGIDPAEALRRSFERRPSANVEAIVEKPFRPGQTMTVRMLYDSTGRRRTEVLSPLAVQGRVFIDDGANWTTYNPDEKLLKVRPAPPDEDLDLRMRLVRRNYRLEIDEKTVIAGRQALRIVATPRDPALKIQRFYVDAANFTPLKTEMVDGIGGVVVQFAVRRVSFPAHLDPYAFSPPSGAGIRTVAGGAPVAIKDRDEIERRVGFRPAMPHRFPSGFWPLGPLDIMDRGGSMPVAIRLSDGLAKVFVFQTRASAGSPPDLRPGDEPRVMREVGDIRIDVRGGDVPVSLRERILAVFVGSLERRARTQNP